MKKLFLVSFLSAAVLLSGCKGKTQNTSVSEPQPIVTGAEQLEAYLPLLEGKKVGMMGNQTSIVGDKHLVDVLLENNVDLKFAFAPEHGFRGDIERGEKVSNDVDAKTGLTLHSLYGKNSKADSIVNSVDVMIFDIQDVGVRFYTYVASMHQVMQLCANNGKKLIILDRPNPTGDQVDGPVRKDDKFKANISFHKIAVVHGLTIGELALMINGEGWLDNGVQCDVEIIKVKGYDHKTQYELPVVPSPSLPNHMSIRLYASLCLFEGTDVSVGRGTDFPFQVAGYPDPACGDFTFTPESRAGMAIHVEQQGKLCYGVDLRNLNPDSTKFTLKYILDFHKVIGSEKFFTRAEFFNKLAGNAELQEQIRAGMTEEQIRATWKEELEAYKQMRKKYLLYPDFE